MSCRVTLFLSLKPFSFSFVFVQCYYTIIQFPDATCEFLQWVSNIMLCSVKQALREGVKCVGHLCLRNVLKGGSQGSVNNLVL